MGHENKCKTPHGHNYVVFFHAVAEELDDIGRVIDFGVLKEKLGGWIDRHWDHAFIVYDKDVQVIHAMKMILDTNKEVFHMASNPTAENMAEYLLHVVCPRQLSETGITIERVELWETENCYAVAQL